MLSNNPTTALRQLSQLADIANGPGALAGIALNRARVLLRMGRPRAAVAWMRASRAWRASRPGSGDYTHLVLDERAHEVEVRERDGRPVRDWYASDARLGRVVGYLLADLDCEQSALDDPITRYAGCEGINRSIVDATTRRMVATLRSWNWHDPRQLTLALVARGVSRRWMYESGWLDVESRLVDALGLDGQWA